MRDFEYARKLSFILSEASGAELDMDLHKSVRLLTTIDHFSADDVFSDDDVFVLIDELDSFRLCIGDLCYLMYRYLLVQRSHKEPANLKEKFEDMNTCATVLDKYFSTIWDDDDCDYAMTCLIGVYNDPTVRTKDAQQYLTCIISKKGIRCLHKLLTSLLALGESINAIPKQLFSIRIKHDAITALLPICKRLKSSIEAMDIKPLRYNELSPIKKDMDAIVRIYFRYLEEFGDISTDDKRMISVIQSIPTEAVIISAEDYTLLSKESRLVFRANPKSPLFTSSDLNTFHKVCEDILSQGPKESSNLYIPNTTGFRSMQF